MKRSESTPLSEAVGIETERVSWLVNLPEYAPAENIGINLKRLGRLARLGGFSHLTIRSYDGGRTEVTPEVVNLDSDGVFTAGGKIQIKKAPLYDHYIDASATPFPEASDALLRSVEPNYDFAWPEGIIKLNITEVDDRLGQIGKLRNPKEWSVQLDKSLRNGLRSITTEHFGERIDPATFLTYNTLLPTLNALSWYLVAKAGRLSTDPQVLGSVGFITHQVAHVMFAREEGLSPKNRRLSLFVGANSLDRLLIMHGVTRAHKLIKELRKT